EKSKIDVKEFLEKKWHLSVWEIVNVLPNSTLEKEIAAFPEELAYRAIKLFSYMGETILDPFVGSGTTMKVAKRLGRNSIGIEIKKDLIPIIKKKVGFDGLGSFFDKEDTFEILLREEKEYGYIS
ncbi:MAG: DNA methyltransferase, partial [Aquificaceae bacterium]